MKILKTIFSIYNDETHKTICVLGLKIKIRNYKLENKLLKQQIVQVKSDLKNMIKKTMPFGNINTVEVHIVDHCNLNCKGCSHFAPLAPESFLDINEFKKDLQRLFEITDGNIVNFDILGGEPLLHPQCLSFLVTAKQIFPKSKIKLVTNGILLTKQNGIFFETCNKYDIVISPTKYLLNVDWENVEMLCSKYNVKLEYFANSDIYNKKMSKLVFDCTGMQDTKEQFLKCWIDNPGFLFLDHGKLYKCAQAPFIRFFNNAFNKNLEVLKQDYIDINKSICLKQILSFMSKPSQFCRYCKHQCDIHGLDWEESKKEISEWTE